MNWTQMWLVWGLGLLVFLFFYMRLLERRYSILKTLLIFYSVQGVANGIKMWFTIQHGPESYPQYSLVIVAISFLFLFIAFKDSYSKKLVVGLLLFIPAGIIEIITIYVCGFFWNITPEQILSENIYLYVTSIEYTLMALFFLLMERIWKKREVKQEAKYDWCFAVMLFGQMLSLMPNIMKVMGKEERISVIAVTGLFTGLAFVVILPTVMSETEKRKTIELKMEQLRQYYELEKIHYELLIKKREEMAKIRHDFNNQLMVVSYLADSDKTYEAKKLLSELEKQIDEERLF